MLPDLSFLLIVGPIVTFGAAVQGSIGLGLGLIAAPVVTLLEPALMPGAMLIAILILPMLMIGSEWRHMDVRGISWALFGRLFGTAAGVWVVAALPPSGLGLALGVLILVTVAATVRVVRFRATPTTLTVSGAISGMAGTATSVGGFPIALVYQHDPGPRVRSTLGGFFFVGVVISLAALGAGGQLTGDQALAGLCLVPFVVAGFFVAAPLKGRVDGGSLRRFLLALVAVSGVTLIVQGLV